MGSGGKAIRCGVVTENGPCRRPRGHDFGWNPQGDRELTEAMTAGDDGDE